MRASFCGRAAPAPGGAAPAAGGAAPPVGGAPPVAEPTRGLGAVAIAVQLFLVATLVLATLFVMSLAQHVGGNYLGVSLVLLADLVLTSSCHELLLL